MNSCEKINNKRRRVHIEPDLEEFSGVKEELIQNEREPELLQENAVKVWSPTDTIKDEDLKKHIDLGRRVYAHSEAQTLGMLHFNNYDLKESLRDFENFTPVPNAWSLEEEMIFENTLQSVGKNFSKIHQALPDRSIGDLVEYYYKWKNKKKLELRLSAERIRTRKMAKSVLALSVVHSECENIYEFSSDSNDVTQIETTKKN
ncbi:hypothetical protein WA026_023028 [Henosepilachna vigintioctopunctata]|uniref:SANT domain-containing protein n=1 Tax=Henosepilachna vigintioctopunctata TaxID=420089 RepID=A0AAW1VHN4_9CUCU